MDLSSYLTQSKLQRQELIKAADRYLNKSLSLDVEGLKENPKSFTGPTPQRFQVFKSQVQEQLQKIFNPHSGRVRIKSEFKRRLKSKDSISKVYSGNSEILKRKQLILIPKNRIDAREGRYFKVLTGIEIQPSQSSVINKEKSKGKYCKTANKSSLLIPILKTVGTHEERNQIYKIK